MSTTPPAPNIPDPTTKPLPHLGEEYGTGKKNLPPAKIVAIVLVILVVVVGILAWVHRPQSSASGSIDDVASAEIPEQNSVMVAVNVSFQNNGKASFKMHSIKAELETENGIQTDDAPASPMDVDRYLQAFPVLKAHALAPLKLETIAPGGQSQGTVIVSFPVTADGFAKRKSLKIIISAYNEVAPLVLVK